jgi:transposase
MGFVEFAMTAPLSRDLRDRIVRAVALRAVAQGSSIRKAAKRFAVSPSAAIKLMQRVHRTGSTRPAKIGGYRRPLLEPHADALRAIVSSNPGITLREIKAALAGRGAASR